MIGAWNVHALTTIIGTMGRYSWHATTDLITTGAQNCGCLKAEFPDNGEIRANNTMPDDLQSCPVRCCLCLYPFEDQLDKAEVEKFRDDVAGKKH